MDNPLDEAQDFASVMLFLAGCYPRFQLTPATIAAYRMVLGDIDLDTLKAAALQCASSLPFFPAAAEIRQAAVGLRDGPGGPLTAGQAWAEVMKAVSDVGLLSVEAVSGVRYPPPEFSDPRIWQAIEAVGGWYQVCMTSDRDIGVLRAHFYRAWDALVARGAREAAMLPQVREAALRLAGNGSGGHPRAIGEVARGMLKAQTEERNKNE